jgi:hypothetical protein
MAERIPAWGLVVQWTCGHRWQFGCTTPGVWSTGWDLTDCPTCGKRRHVRFAAARQHLLVETDRPVPITDAQWEAHG